MLLLSRMLDVDCVIRSHIDLPCTPLQYAAKRGNIDLAKLLLESGANPNKIVHWGHSYGLTALHWAVTSDHKDVVKLLLEQGTAPKKR